MTEGTEGVGHVKNVSRAGLFVRSNDLPRPGATIALQFDAPTSGSSINLRGEVRWTTDSLSSGDPAPGFGVQIHEPPRDFAEFVRWAIEQAEKSEGD